jgi:hypothetical protein
MKLHPITFKIWTLFLSLISVATASNLDREICELTTKTHTCYRELVFYPGTTKADEYVTSAVDHLNLQLRDQAWHPYLLHVVKVGDPGNLARMSVPCKQGYRLFLTRIHHELIPIVSNMQKECEKKFPAKETSQVDKFEYDHWTASKSDY